MRAHPAARRCSCARRDDGERRSASPCSARRSCTTCPTCARRGAASARGRLMTAGAPLPQVDKLLQHGPARVLVASGHGGKVHMHDAGGRFPDHEKKPGAALLKGRLRGGHATHVQLPEQCERPEGCRRQNHHSRGGESAGRGCLYGGRGPPFRRARHGGPRHQHAAGR